MKQHIYADNAATTKLDKAAFDAMTPWLMDEYGNASQPYSFARKPKKALAEARETIANCIGALPEEIFFTSGGTESDNWVIKGSAFSDLSKAATITSAFEHHAVLHSCAAIEKFGYPVAYLWPDSEGYITSNTLKSVITDNTRLVSVMYVNNELGTVQPIKDLCAISHEHGALFHTDAVQAVGHIKIDVHDLGVDFLSASAHKFNGPKGIGFLYIRKGVDALPYIDGGSQESGHRAGTENIASIVTIVFMVLAYNRIYKNIVPQSATKYTILSFFFGGIPFYVNKELVKEATFEEVVVEKEVKEKPEKVNEEDKEIKKERPNFCSNCGNKLTKSAKFCPECGQQIK